MNNKKIYLVEMATYRLAFLDTILIMKTNLNDTGSTGWGAIDVVQGLEEALDSKCEIIQLKNMPGFSLKNWRFEDIQLFIEAYSHNNKERDKLNSQVDADNNHDTHQTPFV